MDFEFDPDHLTLFDDRVSAFFDTSIRCKAIAKKDMLLFDEKSAELVASHNESISAAYTLVEGWIPLNRISISFFLTINNMDQMDLLTLKHGGYVRLLHEKIQVHFVTENGEFDLDISTDYASGEEVEFFIRRDGVTMEIGFGGKHSSFDLPDNCRDGLEVTGFFGEVSNTSARVRRISVRPYAIVAGAVERTEQLKARLAVVNEELGQLQEEPIEPLVEFLNQVVMGETIEAYIQRITDLKLEDIKVMERKALIRAVYNGIANDSLRAALLHHDILKETHYAVARFLDGDQSIETPTVGIGEGIYNTFEFGEINKSNCTSDKLLYLIKTYPDVWLKRLV